jgi:UDP-N-acetylmuramate: L-alanyl-gamma-D-glutamyl-meso-diaminopimelate ligase
MPEKGKLLIRGDDTEALSLAKFSKAPVETYGLGKNNDWELLNYKSCGLSSSFQVRGAGITLDLSWQRTGIFNALNATASVALYLNAKGDPSLLPKAFAKVRGVKRRLEVLGEFENIILLDDFAHHPTAVGETLKALSLAYPERRILAAFEPRSNTTRRAVFQKEYVKAFDTASLIFLSAVDQPEKAPAGDRLDMSRLLADIGKDRAFLFENSDELARSILQKVKPFDLVVIMSNGDFGSLGPKLVKELGLKFGQKLGAN